MTAKEIAETLNIPQGDQIALYLNTGMGRKLLYSGPYTAQSITRMNEIRKTAHPNDPYLSATKTMRRSPEWWEWELGDNCEAGYCQ
jgi:hypothetical protein